VTPSPKRCSSIFDLGPLTPKIDSPKFGKKIAYNSVCMAHRPQMFAPNRGFSGMADSTEPCKMLSGRPLLPWQRNLGKKSPIARLLRQIGRRCFDLLWDFRGWRIQCNHAKSCTTDLCCHGNDICIRRGV